MALSLAFTTVPHTACREIDEPELLLMADFVEKLLVNGGGS
jgi:hypothetical protein